MTSASEEIGALVLAHYRDRDRVRLGAVALGPTRLHRYPQGLPVSERTDFEPV